MAKQHVNVCSDPVLSATACPVFCNRCHIGHWSEWSSWGSCSNGGIKKRSRTCSITDNSQGNMSLCMNESIEYDRSYCNNPSCMPPKIVNLTMTGSLEIGQIAMLHCEVFGNPIPLIDWQILNTSGIHTEIHGDYHEVLKIGPHAQFQSNVFKCRAINRCGSTESSVFSPRRHQHL
ncbi:uncharacterized protein LOC132752906 [Ruditapes philippinarum]|uniref:uncharacterized protein LOC132752906 n=1 Tax=Ruditapes philippinarum TaxID=129788 RepID=UPI00295A57AD|nr:uncharacterized protein LOC132752906 [Ruditapes philippinarum]